MISPQRQIKFEHWANLQSLEAIIAAQQAAPEALSLLAHSAAISKSWAARVEGAPGKIDPWPTLTASGLDSELGSLRDRWLTLADCTAIDAQIEYQNRAGEECFNFFGEILQEVFLHGAHHRGQIALALRLKSCKPPRSTDFIPALRTHNF